jgi:peptidylprolyl isomerase
MRKLIPFIVLLFAACGSPAEEADPLTTPTAPGATPTSEMEACEDRTPPAPPEEDTVGDEKPDVEVPEGAPPCELVSQDIHEGSGAEAQEGATVTVNYVGVSWSTGEEFDSSWAGEPVTFPLGQVIRGWQEGIPGMKEGGRRRLIIPPDLGYGAQGSQTGSIAPNETLIFIIDLIEADAS